MIRLVTFDALHTLITPRKPIHVQYAEVFSPYLGTLPPDAIARSFKLALRQLQAERPSYRAGVERWWSEVVSRTAVGAGADPQAVQRHLGTIVPSLMKRFSSREGYRLFDDSLPTLRTLREMGVRTGLITNSDARIADVLEDLGIFEYLSPVLISETEHNEKPSISIFLAACARGGATQAETLHVGDDFRDDYIGADNAGLHALLLQREGPGREGTPRDTGMDFRTIKSLHVVKDLYSVSAWVEKMNKTH
ncbi:HAD hydrolase subfamily IA REG-2-like protein [Russula vinacea]|nr:HAD hydrolase subfamily IA REG-2-like protein [Russula vinacea]